MRESCTERRARFTLRSSRPGRERRATEEVALRERDTVVSSSKKKVMSVIVYAEASTTRSTGTPSW